MTPNGAVVFTLALIGLIIAARSSHGLAILYVLALAFAAIELGRALATALRRAALLVFPLAAFMLLVWVGVVGRSPTEIAADAPGTRTAALLHVALICARLFLIVLVIQCVFLLFNGTTPLHFIRSLRLPATIKRLLVLTLSLIETLRQAIDRAHTALIAAGMLTRRLSWRNIVNGWVLVQTVWLSAVTIALGRLRDKWPIENTLSLLDHALEERDWRLFAGDDRIWLPIVAGAAVVVLVAA